MESGSQHHPVLLHEALQALRVRPAGCYIDATFGRGGHSDAILRSLDQAGVLLAIDRDAAAVAYGEQRFRGDRRFSIVHAPFSMMAELADQRGLKGKVDGILLDLGVSSPQLDSGARGFSFSHDGPLDMRMDTRSSTTAADWLAVAPQKDIADVLRRLGEERYAGRIAKAIENERGSSPLQSTRQLAELIARVVPTRERGKHPATRSFQAIRIFINRELEELRVCLDQALDVLAPAGRLVVISFHSLEDRMVKRFMRHHAKGEDYPAGLPVTGSMTDPKLRLVGRQVRASDRECRANPRARSAVLRAAERLT